MFSAVYNVYPLRIRRELVVSVNRLSELSPNWINSCRTVSSAGDIPSDEVMLDDWTVQAVQRCGDLNSHSSDPYIDCYSNKQTLPAGLCNKDAAWAICGNQSGIDDESRFPVSYAVTAGKE